MHLGTLHLQWLVILSRISRLDMPLEGDWPTSGKSQGWKSMSLAHLRESNAYGLRSRSRKAAQPCYTRKQDPLNVYLHIDYKRSMNIQKLPWFQLFYLPRPLSPAYVSR